MWIGSKMTEKWPIYNWIFILATDMLSLHRTLQHVFWDPMVGIKTMFANFKVLMHLFT